MDRRIYKTGFKPPEIDKINVRLVRINLKQFDFQDDLTSNFQHVPYRGTYRRTYRGTYKEGGSGWRTLLLGLSKFDYIPKNPIVELFGSVRFSRIHISAPHHYGRKRW